MIIYDFKCDPCGKIIRSRPDKALPFYQVKIDPRYLTTKGNEDNNNRPEKSLQFCEDCIRAVFPYEKHEE